MRRICLITGGARSGKSNFAQALAERVNGSKVFIATCPVLDDELRRRIDRHKESRKNKGWRTIEETVDLQGALFQARDSEVVVVDCLTLWINNLLYSAENSVEQLDEEKISELCSRLILSAKSGKGLVIFVTNEVGMGIVPDNELARRYRDFLGRCNQVVAGEADEVILMISGLPVRIKPVDMRDSP
ncbi:MAG: bifunctional adenosylcobinamide kinase/adenosylcobinamide-phosphate guanylyltransferase [Deltaproteobacteria bacterium]|nr:MAG: bifunctional adenosylcobinamide kinase/adenosylcobinamide-phosphate guanylyltransferase [Deltaproteobacteria bacterium]RLB85856.1 MAG: bifunctional adenosylcobinamide kinase/adenosylcobinamide-phosphate guanylyltransferase [Deltaproteobacteria bacterium]